MTNINQQAASTLSASYAPLLPDVGVIALIPDQWQWRWQPRHQVMTRLARFFPVLWMNPAEPWRESLTIRRFRQPRLQKPVNERGFLVQTPSLFLPEIYSPSWLARLVFRKRIEQACAVLRNRGCKKIVLYLWRPEFANAVQLVPHDLSCYHIDDEYTFSAVDQPIPSTELQLIKSADLVFIHSPALLEKKGKINPNTHFAPNGVDFESYAAAVPAPADIAQIPRPRIGYSGHIKKQLDWPLLRRLAERHPDWSFVFVGAPNAHPEIADHISYLSSKTNVHFLGGKTVQELAHYPQHFDVCTMPYAQDDYTKYIYPLKLHEYLASGTPVVGTRIASLEAFRHVVPLAATPDEWSAALTSGLGAGECSPEAREKRQRIAKMHDWRIIVGKIAAAIAERLGPPYLDRLSAQSGVEARFSLQQSIST